MADPDAVAFLASVVAASTEPGVVEQVSAEQRPATRTITITQDPLVRVRDTPGIYVLFGGQYFATVPHSKISVEMDLVLQGSPGNLQLGILPQSDQGKHFSRRMPRQSTGDRLRLVFDYYATEALESLAHLSRGLPVLSSVDLCQIAHEFFSSNNPVLVHALHKRSVGFS